MSYLKPKAYFQLAEQMASSYADYTGANSNDYSINITKHAVSEPDDDSDESSSVLHDTTRDPAGSVANDMGNIMSTLSATFTEDQAKVIAASYFKSALQLMNNHVITRTPLPPDPANPDDGRSTNLNTINNYFSAYKDDPRVFGADNERASEMGLFTWVDSADDYFTGGYFSDNFAELSLEAGVTIDPEFVQSTYA
jgi:hypothetical protein